MTHPRLTGTQSAVMFVLMARADEIRNPDLARFGPELRKADREKLVDAGFVELGRDGRASTLTLTDAGWAWCADELAQDPPARATPQLKALYTVLHGLGRHLDATDARLHEVFTPAGASATDATPKGVPEADSSVSERIRDAYVRRATGPAAWVSLTDLRRDLADVPRDGFDAAVRELERVPGVGVIPQEDQALLTPADRDAAVVIGTQRCHLISIASR